ncbi:MAG: hypothetical protein JNK30_08420 [Phenylobacterium sp.]|uniref:hypothetical protein n=1 Tax=Phenylobacterium sp. TaxID=1871053 RepID=UPI001A513F2C|nr:hypothetical protein [Phenylobacterium sp.]MBL8771393.1 hypothetical protein [Phenylobacterium sp.]
MNARPAAALALAAAGAALAVGPAAAQPGPQDRAREAAAMLTAAGYAIRGNQILNGCGRPARPVPTAVDLNGDGRSEAIVTDVDPACYGPAGAGASVIWRDPAGRWRRIGGAAGRIRVLPTVTGGWRDYTLDAPGAQPVWAWAGEAYLLKPASASGPPPATATADRAAAFRAAGFTARAGRYPACDPRQEATIEIRDLNGDGRPDAVVTDEGTNCFGMTGTGYVIVTKEASGAWRRLFANAGIPKFLPTRGAGGWPDIENGGPGFCHPILRWTGSDYAIVRWKAEEAGACAGRR